MCDLDAEIRISKNPPWWWLLENQGRTGFGGRVKGLSIRSKKCGPSGGSGSTSGVAGMARQCFQKRPQGSRGSPGARVAH